MGRRRQLLLEKQARWARQVEAAPLIAKTVVNIVVANISRSPRERTALASEAFRRHERKTLSNVLIELGVMAKPLSKGAKKNLHEKRARITRRAKKILQDVYATCIKYCRVSVKVDPSQDLSGKLSNVCEDNGEEPVKVLLSQDQDIELSHVYVDNGGEAFYIPSCLCSLFPLPYPLKVFINQSKLMALPTFCQNC